MQTHPLKAELREPDGKGAARRLRAEGAVPAIFYGPGTEPTSIAVSPKEIDRILSTPHGRNSLVKLELTGGREELALIKDVHRDPVSFQFMHVDFYRADVEREVYVEVPFRTRGRAVGVQKGGTLHVTLRSLPIQATPNKIPAAIEVDVTRLEINGIIRVQDLELPEGVTVRRSPQQTLVTIMPEAG